MSECPICRNEFDTSRAFYRDGELICMECRQIELEQDVDPTLDLPFGGLDHTKREVIAFVGENHEYYLRKWDNIDARASTAMGWNFSACLFSTCWLGYRKMYPHLLAFFSLYYFLMLCGALFAIPYTGLVLSLTSIVVMGCFGNSMYYRHMKQKLKDHSLKNQGSMDLKDLKAMGGGSTAGLALAIGLNTLVPYIFVTVLRFIISIG